MLPHRAFFPDFCAIISAGSSIAAWQEQMDWSLRIFASLLAIGAGLYSIILRHKRNKETKRKESLNELD
jgi:hypothetical protein